MAYTDQFNVAFDKVKASLQTVSGLPVIDNPQNAAGFANGYVLIQAPSFQAFNFNVTKLSFEIQIVLPPQGNLSALRRGMQIAAALMALKIGVLSGRPGMVEIGGTEAPAYLITLDMEAQEQ